MSDDSRKPEPGWSDLVIDGVKVPPLPPSGEVTWPGKFPRRDSSCLFTDGMLDAATLKKGQLAPAGTVVLTDDGVISGEQYNKQLSSAEFKNLYTGQFVTDPKRDTAYFLALLYHVRTEEVDRELPHQLVHEEARVAQWRIADSNKNAQQERKILHRAAEVLGIDLETLNSQITAAARLGFEMQKELLLHLPEEVRVAHEQARRCVQPAFEFKLEIASFNDFRKFMQIAEEDITSALIGTPEDAHGGSIDAARVHAKHTARQRESVVFNINCQIFGSTMFYYEQNGMLYRREGMVKPPIAIGTTRGNFSPDNRLRKFVLRRGQLVEVRTRGRTGYRSLIEAVEAALNPKPKLRGHSVGHIFIDDALVKETP